MHGHWGIFRHKLQRKLIRDLMASKGLFLAVTAVIFLGVAFFGASFIGYQNLRASYDYTYETLHFADFTVRVVEAPEGSVAELEPIPGVSAVTGRMNSDVSMTLPGVEEKRVLARVISLPSGARPAVNDVKVEEGGYFEGGESGAVLVEKSFAEHHGLGPEDTVSLTVNDRIVSFDVSGIVTSPEYIWPAKNRQEILVSPETFGVVFIPEEAVTGLMGRPFLNEFCFLVEEGANDGVIIESARDILTPYEVTDVVPASEQPSNAAVGMQQEQMGEFAHVFPILFLIVGALATYILLVRIIHNQRSHIGLMRAQGHSRRDMLIHYLSFALVIGIAGTVAGTIVGYLLSGIITDFYVDMLGIPYAKSQIHWIPLLVGFFIGILPCILAGIFPAWTAARLRPTEAMRGTTTDTGRRLALERYLPFITRLSILWKIPLRNLFRNRRRSICTIIGVTFGISLILFSVAFIDSIDDFMGLQFDRIQKYDAQIVFTELQPESLSGDVQKWDEVVKAEPVLQIPVRFEHENHSYSSVLTGLSPESELYGLYSGTGERVSVSEGVILLSDVLQDTLAVDVGDKISVFSSSGSEQLTVGGFVKQTMGSYGFVTLDHTQEFAAEQPVISSLMLDVQPQYMDLIREKAYQIQGAASVELTAESESAVGELMYFIRSWMWVMLGFGAVLALSIVFTIVTVNIMERRREIAAMRVLGESKIRNTFMITIENLLTGIVGILPGIVLGYALVLYLFRLFQNEMFTMYMVIYPRTYLLTIALVLLILLISQIPSIRYINRLDLTRVIREQAN